MKVHLRKNNLERSFSFCRMKIILPLLIILMVGMKSVLWAEGSKDFVNYPGNRMFLDTRDPQQLKVYANAGETINVGASHVGIQGGFITVYDPTGNVMITYNNTGATSGLAIINNNIEEAAGPTGGGSTNGNGYRPGVIDVPAGKEGIWTVVFDYPSYSTAQFTNILNSDPWTRVANQPQSRRVVLAWDVTVTSGGAGNQGGTPIEGRLYSNEHISLLNGNSNANNTISVSPTFFVLTEDGYLYQVDIMDADPFRFPISSNSFGLVTADGTPIYKSKPESAFTRSADPSSWTTGNIYLFEPQAQGVGAITNNKIFFNVPDPNMPSTAMVTDIFRNNTHDIWLFEPIQILTINSISFFAQSNSGSPCTPGTIEFAKGGYFVFDTNLGGVVTLQLDLNNNGVYSDPVDVTLMGTLSEGVDSLYWNGYNGIPEPVAVQDSLVINYQGSIRYGELHIALTDVEGNNGGVTFDWLNAPAGFPTDQFYYDHTDIGGPVSGGGTPGNALPTNIPYTYPVNQGNNDYIDQWFFIEQSIAEDSLVLNVVLDCFCDPEDLPSIAISGSDVCEGDELILSATNANTQNNIGPIDYVWTGPNNHLFSDPDVDPNDSSIDSVTTSATLLNTGTYTVIATTSSLCADTVDIAIDVALTPVLITDSLDIQVCENGDVQFCATNVTAGIGQFSYSIQGPNGYNVSGIGNGTDQVCNTLTNVSPSFEGQYTVVVTAGACVSEPLVFNLDIQPTPEINGTSPNGVFCAGTDVILTASNNVQGTGDIIYCWTGPNFAFCDTTSNENGPFNVTIPNIQVDNAGDYTLVLTTLAGCASTPQTITIGVNPIPEICTVTGGGDACVGQNVTLSAFNCAAGINGPISFSWTGPGGVALCDGTANNDGPFTCDIADLQPNMSGTYCLILTDDATDCSSSQECVDINVLPSIVITDITPDSSYCEGSTITLTATTSFGATVIYTWTAPDGSVLISIPVAPGTPLSATIDILSAANAGNYILTVASLDGCASEPDTVFVGMYDGITITSVTGGGTYCAGDSVMLSGTGEGNSATVDYVWTNPAGDTIGSGNTPPAGPYDADVTNPVEGNYILTVTTPEGCTDVDSVLIQFSETPIANIVSPTTDTTLCELDSIVLCGQNTNPNSGSFTYTWTTPSGDVITGTGNGTDVFCDTIMPIDTFGSGIYTLVICEGNCCSDPDSVNIFLNPNPTISIVSGGGTYCEGDTAIVCFSNTNPLVADWFYTCVIGDTTITQTGSGTTQICIEITEPTFICCSLESMDGCVSSLECAEVLFDPNYTPEITVDTIICANDTLQLNGTNPSTCTGTVTYTWTGPNGFVFTGMAPCEGPFPAIDPNPNTGEYCLDLDAGGTSDCSQQVCTTVVVLELPFIVGGTINGGGEFCDIENVVLSATIENPSGGDIDYEWTQNGDVIASGTAASGDSISIDLNALGLGDGDYCLNLTCVATGCSDEGIGCTQVTFNETPIVDMVSGGGTYCQGFDVMLNGSGPACTGTVSYTWTGPNNFSFTGSAPCGGPYPVTIDNIDVDQAGVYTLTVTNGDCTSEPMSVVVEVNPTPDIINTSGSGAECAGATTTISFTIDPDGAASVDWSITGPGLDTSGTVTVLTAFDFDVVVNGDAKYIITAISDQGCEAEPVSIMIQEIMVPVPNIFVDPTNPCPGDDLVLSTEAVTGATYTWCLDGTVIGGPSPDPTIVVVAMEGAYTVKITLDGCTEESAPFVLMFPLAPVAVDDSYTTQAGVPITGENVLTNDDLGNGAVVSNFTQPDNGSVDISPNGEMTYTPNNGFSGTDQFTYTICSNECEELCDQATVTIIVETPPCEIPNVITPNGDGVNDVLIIDCVPGFTNNRLRIFNRWGDEIAVFEPYTNDEWWDGTSGADKEPVPAGTYFYLFQEDRSVDDHKAGYVKVVR